MPVGRVFGLMGIEVKVGRNDVGRDLFNATFGRESLVAGAIAGRDVRFAAADGTGRRRTTTGLE